MTADVSDKAECYCLQNFKLTVWTGMTACVKTKCGIFIVLPQAMSWYFLGGRNGWGCISFFIFQAFQQSSLEKLDQQLSSTILKSIPSGGFQELQRENTPEIGTTQLYCFFGNYTKKPSWLTNQGVFRSDMTSQKHIPKLHFINRRSTASLS